MNVHKLRHPFNEGEFIWGHPLTWDIKYLTPILITDYILVNSGFIKEQEDENIKYSLKDFIVYKIIDCFYYNSSMICSLHDLQNKFFDYTNEELNLYWLLPKNEL